NTELCSQCHPFYTGKQKTMDTGGRIEKFESKLRMAEASKEKLSNKKERHRKSMEEKGNEELQKQASQERKKEEKLMAKIKKNRPAEGEKEGAAAETEA
ncbi:MAG: 50S ribosomal protein L31, partial [Candidatus Peregrinibacteria bacterium GW2011_GWA2_44_7]